MTKFEKKVQLYCTLHGNLLSNLPEKWEAGVSYVDSDNCRKCRAKNNGVCNVRYFTYRVIYNRYSHQILKINFENLPITYRKDYGAMYLDEKEYSTITTHISTFCFGFLSIDKDA